MTSTLAIRVDGVSKRYGRTQALTDISFDVRQHELFALLGPNGAGKTTLLHILCTILQPDSGNVYIGGLDVIAHPARGRRGVGVIFQEPSLDDRLTVYENLNFHGLVYGVPAKLRRQRIEELLALVELTEWREKLVRTLSSGMKRRVEIARALIHDSRILFLDEPTVGLDAQSRERIWQYIDRLRSQRELTIVVTTHYIDEVEGCDRLCIIDSGKILAMDTPSALKAAHGQQLLRVVPREDTTASEIMTTYPDSTIRHDSEIIIKSSGDAFAEAFLSRFGGRIRRLFVEEPSLESVFLSLTGREIRDQAAGGRERTLAFGRQGGEHTR
ncbi:MAG: type transport system ATP-binding protein [Acetobacteraceae bacterium]|jgi:ABC-2 type transport system ATP-binding protein|nr:type transport system ATP-binding protein [Acetobacteraceae bacterium]MEA2769068.1 type transport system ATP-binding protein [Acetobacteraceae bacterium]